MADWVSSIVRTRYLVASLGESSSPPWWRSEATTPPGRRMLERLYRRTVLAASLEVAGRAARSVHDARIGRLGTCHLFRLPMGDESAIREYVACPEGMALLADLFSIEGGAARLANLAELAQGDRSEAQGPVRCGTVSELRKGVLLPRLCALYARAFSSGQPVYPYMGGADS